MILPSDHPLPLVPNLPPLPPLPATPTPNFPQPDKGAAIGSAAVPAMELPIRSYSDMIDVAERQQRDLVRVADFIETKSTASSTQRKYATYEGRWNKWCEEQYRSDETVEGGAYSSLTQRRWSP